MWRFCFSGLACGSLLSHLPSFFALHHASSRQRLLLATEAAPASASEALFPKSSRHPQLTFKLQAVVFLSPASYLAVSIFEVESAPIHFASTQSNTELGP